MYLSGGISLPVKYLIECWWFDFSRSVSTHHRMTPDQFLDDPDNEKNCVIYMCSWTSVVRRSTVEALTRIKALTNAPPVLIDIGSGKGKTLLVWSENKNISLSSAALVGVEFSTLLMKIYKRNISRRKKIHKLPKAILIDVLDCNLFQENKPYILYLYNPFPEHILESFIAKIEKELLGNQPVIIIYNNPVHDWVIRKKRKFELICKWDHWHPNGRVNFYNFVG